MINLRPKVSLASDQLSFSFSFSLVQFSLSSSFSCGPEEQTGASTVCCRCCCRLTACIRCIRCLAGCSAAKYDDA